MLQHRRWKLFRQGRTSSSLPFRKVHNSTSNAKRRRKKLEYLAVIESCVAFVNPSKARFRKHSPYPRGALGRASLLMVFALVCGATYQV